MDSWLSALDLPGHPLGYHQSLSATKLPRSLSVDVYEKMLRSYALGSEHDGPSREKTSEIGRQFDPVVASLLQGAFLCGNGSRGFEEESGRHAGIWFACESCAGIKRLVRAFLAMNRWDRKRAFVAAKVGGHRALEICIIGALCEAHVVSILLDVGLIVLESTVDEDVNLGIDAIALLPGALDGNIVQVKGYRAAAGIEFLRVERDATSRETWQKTENFNRAYSVSFSPVAARVGTGKGGLFEYDSPENIESAKNFFNRLRDPS